MTAATVASRHGLSVAVVDEQATPGGQIWRSIEGTRQNDDVLGAAYVEGSEVSEAFRASGVTYLPGAQLWQIERGFRAYMSEGGNSRTLDARAMILATGAQERPVPFPGWTLPGVLTVGAAQILLKGSGQVPEGATWIAGSGPLPLLYAVQLLRAGGSIAGYLDTTPGGRWASALPHLAGALRASGDLLKGLGWMNALRRSGTLRVSGAHSIEARGGGRLDHVRYMTRAGREVVATADTLLVHEGVVPSIHAALSLGCEMRWSDAQDCFAPVVDEWGETTMENLFVAGDGAGIAGAKAALLRGELAALRVAAKLDRLGGGDAVAAAWPVRRKLERELAPRPFLDAMFKPRQEVFAPSDDTIVCRCEEVTAGSIRAVAKIGCPGPNQIKASTRAGMGPCQGRQCGYTITRLLSAAQGRSPEDVGFNNIRPPLKPVTIGELASLDSEVAYSDLKRADPDVTDAANGTAAREGIAS